MLASVFTTIVGDVSQCIDLTSRSTSPCGPGNQVCPPGLFDNHSTPQFHVKDASCVLNDPNGPSYDPVHGVYHLHYQNHVGLHGGRTYGHAVTKDLIHWAHMPNSIWNDQYVSGFQSLDLSGLPCRCLLSAVCWPAPHPEADGSRRGTTDRTTPAPFGRDQRRSSTARWCRSTPACATQRTWAARAA
jgi:hypothetical protein